MYKHILARVVILSIWSLSGRWASIPVHYIWYELDILDIFFEYSLKIPKIHSNMLKYTQIFPYQAGMKVYRW
jgi:hypothetical protein